MIRNIFLTVLLLLASGVSFALSPVVWKSSYTATADTTKNLCMNQRGFFHGVIISSPSAAGGSLTVYASSAAALNPIAVIDTRSIGSYTYDVGPSTTTGLTYSTVGTPKVTILYQCY